MRETRTGKQLKKGVLPFSEVIAQSIANIAPTNAAALTIPFIFASAGNGTWLAFVIATVGLIFVGQIIAEVARRHRTSGGLYSYTRLGLGQGAGFITGWALLLAYVTTGIAVVAGFGHFGHDLLARAGVQIPYLIYFAVVCAVIWFMAYRDVQLSTKVMLWIEGIFIGVILILAAIILARGGLDLSQFTLQGVSLSGLQTALVLAVFAYVGFENATTLGEEAKDGGRSIPRAVLLSTLLAGTFFVLIALVEVSGFRAAGQDLAKSTAPLIDLANLNGVSFFGVIAALGTICACFACGLACVNGAARVMYRMSRDGYLPTAFGDAHDTNETPHIGVSLASALLLLVPLGMVLSGITPFDTYAIAGTISTYGFIVGYLMVTIAGVLYLSRRGEVQTKHYLFAALGVLFLLIPIYGSIPTAATAFPYNILPIIFGVYLILGGLWYFTTRSKAQPIVEETV